MGVERGVARRSREALVLAVRNVYVCFGIAVPLGQTEIDHMHNPALAPRAHQKIVRLDIAVNKVSAMKKLDARDLPGAKSDMRKWRENGGDARAYELLREHEHCFERKAAVAKRKKILQARPQQVHHHDRVVAFMSKPAHDGNADCKRGGELVSRL